MRGRLELAIIATAYVAALREGTGKRRHGLAAAKLGAGFQLDGEPHRLVLATGTLRTKTAHARKAGAITTTDGNQAAGKLTAVAHKALGRAGFSADWYLAPGRIGQP